MIQAPNRTDHLDEIFQELRRLAEVDLRIGQALLVVVESDKLYSIENNQLLKLLKEQS